MSLQQRLTKPGGSCKHYLKTPIQEIVMRLSRNIELGLSSKDFRRILQVTCASTGRCENYLALTVTVCSVYSTVEEVTWSRISDTMFVSWCSCVGPMTITRSFVMANSFLLRRSCCMIRRSFWRMVTAGKLRLPTICDLSPCTVSTAKCDSMQASVTWSWYDHCRYTWEPSNWLRPS